MIEPKSVVNGFRRVFNSDPSILVSAPGRLDFLNTHQDYKGLPVVAIGVNLRTYVALAPSEDDTVRVYSENLGVFDEFSLDDIKLLGGKWFGDYVRAVYRVFRVMGHKIRGVRAYIASDVPVAAGLASSAALEVAIAWGLRELYGLRLGRSDIAEYAFMAENQVMGIPCGRLDQYGSVYGGVVLIQTRPPYQVEELGFRKGVWIVVDTGIKHSTGEIHPRLQREIDNALSQLMKLVPENLKSRLGYRHWEPRWEELKLEELTPYLKLIDKVGARRIEFTLRMHASTLLALRVLRGVKPGVKEVVETLGFDWIDEKQVREVLESSDWDLKTIGLIMTYQHMLLSKLYDVSLPEIDHIVEVMLEAGALGGKLSGAGLGGSVIALCRDQETAEKVLNEVLACCAPRGWIVEIDEGAKTHYTW